MTMEEKEWLECNPVYVIKNDKLYYKRDILELPRNCKCKLTVECVHSESAYPTVPTLSIPNGYNGYITVNAEKYPQIPNLSTKKSSKLSIRIAEKYPGHLFCESNTGLLAVSFQSWIPAELKMSRWWESTAFPDLAMTRTEIAPNKIQYACNAAGRRVEFQDKPSDFDKYVFTVEWETDPDIKNEKMPKLLLQPVVENAIEHGIDEKEEGDKKLFLSFKGQGDDVEIIVRDNGTGMEQEKAETLVTYQAKGYGLKNVNDRIRLLYGESYGIQIYSAPGEGTTVIMRFPKEIRNYEE